VAEITGTQAVAETEITEAATGITAEETVVETATIITAILRRDINNNTD